MISTVEKVLFLKGVGLFRTIPGEDLVHIAQITEVLETAKDVPIFSEGDKGDALYLIVDGKVKVHSQEHVFATLSRSQCFGEMSILDSEPRSATVTSLSELTLLKIAQEDFTDILAEKPEIAIGIMQVLTSRLREANSKR